MIARRGKLDNPVEIRTVESAVIDGREVEVHDLVRVDLLGKRPCLAKVCRIDVDDEGEVTELTVALWTSLNGRTHPQQGLTRVLFPASITPLARQPRA